MALCPYTLLEELGLALCDAQEAIDDCAADEPLAVAFCIEEVANAILVTTRLVRRYQKEGQEIDDDDQDSQS